MTHNRPLGTVTLNRFVEGALPLYRYGSSSGTPLTVIRPDGSQHATVSPPTPITRLIRSCSSSDGSMPTNTSPCLICLSTGGGSSAGFLPSQPPGSRKTTTSPRSGVSPNHGENLSTSTRSPMLMVCSIDPDGM